MYIVAKPLCFGASAHTVVDVFRGRISYTEVYDMLRNMEPPVGFGKKCPYRLAYRASYLFI